MKITRFALCLTLAAGIQACNAQQPAKAPAVTQAAKPVTSDRATDLVHDAVMKKHLSTLKEQCISYVDPVSQGQNWVVDVREKHGESCGGDPQTAPRMFTFQVNKKTGALFTDAGSPEGQMKPLK